MKSLVGGRTAGRAETSRRIRIQSQHASRAFWRWLLRAVLAGVDAIVGFAVAAAVLVLCVLGTFRNALDVSPGALVALGGLAVLLFVRLMRRATRGKKPALAADVELGTLFVAGAFAAIEVAGGPAGLAYPLVYAIVAFLVAYSAAAAAAYFLGLVLATEAAIQHLSASTGGWRLFASHASFNLLFGLLSALFLRAEVRRRRVESEREVRGYLDAINTAAQEYRLTSGASHRELSAEEMSGRRQVGSVQAIQEALYNVLGVAERALAPHTVALLWLDASDRNLSIKELRSASDHVTEKPIAAGEGFCGAIGKRREPLVLSNLRPGHAGLVYYERPEPVTDFAGVPVLDGAFLRGVLVADRIDGKPFDDSDVAVMTTIAGEIVRAVQVERVFAEMDRDKFQKERFYEASREFNHALNIREVAQTTIAAARRLAQIDFAAVAVSLEEENRMRIEALDWAGHDQAQGWLGRELSAEQGLVGAAIKARHPLPHGTSRGASQSVFGPGIELPLPAVKVVPLIARGRGVGALVLGSEHEEFLPLGTLDMIKVIANHAAIALSNAQLYEHNERLATTDGLTGLTNHRHFQRVFDQMLAQAERYGRKLSVILTDIDHFKSVNDTYGHPVGDKVLKRVAAILSQSARTNIDVVARYGGEEFAVLLPETDRAGALRLAERIRSTVAQEQFYCENGKFKATVSLGVSTFPEDAAAKAKLIDGADQALYAAKREGRNRTITFEMLRSRREAPQSA